MLVSSVGNTLVGIKLNCPSTTCYACHWLLRLMSLTYRILWRQVMKVLLILVIFFFIFTEPPQPTKKCPRRNGFFAHPDPSVCNIFYNCIDGEAIEITCTTGLHFDEYSGTCVWPDSAGREVNFVLYFTCVIYFFF